MNVTEPAVRGERRKPTECRHGFVCYRQMPPAASAANYRLCMADGSPDDEAVVGKNAALIVGRLSAKLGELTESIQQLLVTKIADLGGDPQLTQLLRDTVSGNVDTFFAAIRHGIPVTQVEPPTAALEYARRLAQREVSADALVRAYRLGHQAALDAMLGEIRAADLDRRLSLDVYERMAATSFEYIDWISQRVIATYQDERERWLENRNNLRALQVREILAGGDVDVDAMTTSFRYPLRGIHLAVVVWCPESDDGAEPAALEASVRKLAKSVGAQDNSLFISVDRVTGWGWISLPAAAAVKAAARLRKWAKTNSGPCIAAGNPLPGVDGFRRSHQQAQDARNVAIAAGAPARRVTLASDPGLSVAALLGSDLHAAAAWIGDILGALASQSEGDERLRETLLVYLRSGSSYTAAAEELHLHFNSVKYRVQRAIERRGRPIADDRSDVEVALLLCHWFGAAVLS
jgi:DNA-binding PucR family transcriptional regulator